ncbi:unnamed protein product [Malus baccata var. baccata]
MTAFSTLLKLKDSHKFEWREEDRAAFTQIKVALATLPILVPPRLLNPLSFTFRRPKNPLAASLHKILMLGENKLFSISADTSTLKRSIIRLSRNCYVPQKAVKGQALADFLAHHSSPYGFGGTDVEIRMVEAQDNYWTMYFDGSSTSTSAGVGIVLQSPHQHHWFFSLKLDFDCTNNQAEYEALVIGLSILHNLYAARVLVFGDSELVIHQLNDTFRCMSCTLVPYHMVASYLAESLNGIIFNHISCGRNIVADELAQIASEA